MRTICDTLLADAREHTPTAPGIAEVVPALRRLAELLDAPPHLTITVEGEHLTTGIPPARLERIASPLLTNACRYARSTVTVTVHAHHTPDGVRLDVTDDGHTGAGLGLPLARRLARSAGGEVSYDDGHAPGARFVITLPS
jgi:signal transduction histidine kinase